MRSLVQTFSNRWGRDSVGGHKRLAQANATVTGGHFGVEVDFEGFGTQAVQHPLEQEHILKAAAAEANAIQLRLFADFFC